MDKELGKMLKALVVGGTGFLGSKIANFLVSKGYEVWVLRLSMSRDSIYDLRSQIRVVSSDISEIKELKACGISWEFNLVINCGGYVNHSSFFKANDEIVGAHLIGTLNLVKLINNKKLKKYIHIGSSDEYGDVRSVCIEEMREAPLSTYAFSKVASTHFLQMIAKSEDFPSVIIRPFLVYGSDQDENRLLPYVVQSCINNDEFELTNGNQVRDFLYIDDFINAINVIIEAPTEKIKGKIYNIVYGKSYTIAEVVDIIVRLTGGGKPLFGAKKTRSNESPVLKANLQSFQRDFKWEPKISLIEGLKRLIEFRRKNIKD